MSELLTYCQQLEAEAQRRGALLRGNLQGKRGFLALSRKPRAFANIGLLHTSYVIELFYPLLKGIVQVAPTVEFFEGDDGEILHRLQEMAIFPAAGIFYGHYENGQLAVLFHSGFVDGEYHKEPAVWRCIKDGTPEPPGLVIDGWFQAHVFWELVESGYFVNITPQLLESNEPLLRGYTANKRQVYRYKGVDFIDPDGKGGITIAEQDIRPYLAEYAQMVV